MNNKSEKIISQINSNVFFKEFTFSKNDFTDLDTKQELEFSDNVVWIDDIFFIFEIKDRNSEDLENDSKWFNNKVLKKAVSQIKSTHKYLEKYPNIPITNEKGHTKNITEAKFENIKNIIIYTPNDNFSEDKRHLKFYESKIIGFIHLFHSEDYYWICKYLITPAEVEEYLTFREKLFQKHSNYLNNLPEQYVLGHFLETLDTSELKAEYINNLINIKPDSSEFNMSYIIDNFNKNIQGINEKTEYYPIIAEIAKLKRSELAEFKKRFIRTIEKCKENDIDLPYRIYVPRTDCGFVFIPLIKKASKHWKTALSNFTYAQKYDQKASKCVGLVIFENTINDKVVLDMYWSFLKQDWEYDEEMEKRLYDSFPFRKVNTKLIENRYKD
ncbi:hypothetical protein [Lutibacter oceani]|nr:hypothetical protein [Lutibacter oceani]